MKSVIKNLIIAALVFSSVMLTGRLWFGVSIGPGFFNSIIYVMQSRAMPDDYPEKALIAHPYRIVTSASDGGAYIFCGDSVTAALRRYSDRLILSLFNNGVFIDEYESDYDFGERYAALDYAFSLPAGVFAECFNDDLSPTERSLITSRLRLLNRIVIMPDESDENKAIFLFIDDTKGTTYKYEASITAADAVALLSRADELAKGRVIDADSDTDLFIQSVNPFISPDGVITLRSVERSLAPIFGQRPINQAVPEDANYRFANDANVVCRYILPVHMLDYSDYSTVNRQNPNDLISGFSTAVRFISKDINVKNELYLSFYQFNGESYLFRFSCIAAGMPVYLSDTIKEATGIESYIEITVENQKTVKYKRLAPAFEQYAEEDSFAVSALYTQRPPFDIKFGFVYEGMSPVALSR